MVCLLETMLSDELFTHQSNARNLNFFSHEGSYNNFITQYAGRNIMKWISYVIPFTPL